MFPSIILTLPAENQLVVAAEVAVLLADEPRTANVSATVTMDMPIMTVIGNVLPGLGTGGFSRCQGLRPGRLGHQAGKMGDFSGYRFC